MKNSNGGDNHGRGLNIAVINPDDGRIKMGRAFDTHESSEEMEKWIKNDEKVSKGCIVAAACKDDCSANLSDTVKNKFLICVA